MAKTKTTEIAETAAAAMEEKTVVPKTTAKKTNEIVFLKRSFLRFDRYAKVRDLLGAVLDDDKKYSIREVDEILKAQGGGK